MSPSREPSHSSGPRASLSLWLTTGVAAIAIAAAGVAIGMNASASESDSNTGAEPGPTATSTPSTSTAPDAARAAAPPPAPASEVNAPADDGTVTFTLAAAGDVLTHGPVLTSARTSDGYDFAPLLDPVRDYVANPDLAICHLEVPVAPAGTEPSGYPVFGAPEEIVGALHDEGWDGCSTASNHSLDRGFAGVEATLDTFDDVGMGHSGTARTEVEADSVQMYRVRTGGRLVTVANISYSYGLNGLPKPSGKPWAANTFDADAEDAQPIIDRAQDARDAGAEVVIASVHCCVEYQTAPTDAQRAIVEEIAASGLVDLYIGHHAHVPQPIELTPGGPSGEGMWTAFGLGNFLSNQDTQCCVANTNSGILLSATFAVSPDDDVDVGVEWTAVTVDRRDSHTVHALRDIPDGTTTLTSQEVAARLKRVSEAAGTQASERTEPAAAAADDSYWVPRGQS
ncbi:CapA family protein [Demequina aurantiaca]|uniref:CapA family protein n=1 Tax=Demequina aurantiaca TaxID=676200 RepID=UPI003D341A5E